jgi:hypothetical protein
MVKDGLQSGGLRENPARHLHDGDHLDGFDLPDAAQRLKPRGSPTHQPGERSRLGHQAGRQGHDVLTLRSIAEEQRDQFRVAECGCPQIL